VATLTWSNAGLRHRTERFCFSARSGSWKKHLRRVDVALSDRALGVPGLQLHVRQRIPRHCLMC
jgi:hypothetical protein